MAIYDRIDLKVLGDWAKNFRPNGLVLSFGTNLDGGARHTVLAGPCTLPVGITIGSAVKQAEVITNYTVNKSSLPKTALNTTLTGARAYSNGVIFPSNFNFTQKVLPQGVADPGNNYVPQGTLVSGQIDQLTSENVTLSTSSLAYGTYGARGVTFPSTVTLNNLYIPFNTKFLQAQIIEGITYTGIYELGLNEKFLMQTVQLITVEGKAVISVHDIASDETMAFNRPATDIDRLIMYRNGIGIDAEIFACYNIIFKTNITAADIDAFNKLHPSDVNPIIIDDGSMKNLAYIIPVA